MATLALSMDMSDSTSQRKDCYAFFDAKHDRTLGMKTITLWTYDPSTQRILQLAVMESDREDTESLTVFWECFNEMLQTVSNNPAYKFNPKGWIMGSSALATFTSLENNFFIQVVIVAFVFFLVSLSDGSNGFVQ